MLFSKRAWLVENVVSFRADLVKDIKPITSLEGRLLVYFPDLNLSDGAAEQASGGFFDADNAPPWDTWLSFVDDGEGSGLDTRFYLIAWVPAAFVELAQAGIDVNPEQCIEWLYDTSTRAKAELARWLSR
jgi:hypothetical protein